MTANVEQHRGRRGAEFVFDISARGRLAIVTVALLAVVAVVLLLRWFQ